MGDHPGVKGQHDTLAAVPGKHIPAAVARPELPCLVGLLLQRLAHARTLEDRIDLPTRVAARTWARQVVVDAARIAASRAAAAVAAAVGMGSIAGEEDRWDSRLQCWDLWASPCQNGGCAARGHWGCQAQV